MQIRNIAAALAVASLYACASVPPAVQEAAGTLAHKPDVAADYFYAVCQQTDTDRADILKEFNVAIYPHVVTLVCGPRDMLPNPSP